MKFFFDARYTKPGDFHDGSSRYSAELGKALLNLPEVDSKEVSVTFLIFDDGQKKWFPKHANFLKIHSPTSAREPFSALILNKYSPDVLFSPMQTIGSWGRKFKLILTLHDLIYYRHRTPPKNLSPAVRLGWRAFHLSYTPQRLTLNRADAVATVSYTSKHDFEAVKLTKRPIFVTHNAAQNLGALLKPNSKKTAQASNAQNAPTNLIYMGSFMGYKNVETLIYALEYLPNYTLHLLSKITPKRQAEYEAIKPEGAKIIYHNGVSDEEYARLLVSKAIMVSGSKDEGYGIPVVDAAALGVPGVITDMPIFHEVAGKGALYFDPRNPKDFADKIVLASKPSTYKKLSEAAAKQSQKFSWSDSASVLLKEALNLLQ